MLSELIGGLRGIRDEVRSTPALSATTYRFGARDLTVHVPPHRPDLLPRGGLVESVGMRPDVHLYVIDRDAVERLRFPAEAVLAPYGALVDSLATEWLILRSPDTGKVLAFDRETQTALYFPGNTVPPRDRAEFCRPLLHWLAILDGNVVVHAGGVAREGRGLLVAGAANAGKSTLTRVCLAAGYDYLGDNVVELDLATSGSSRLFPVYPTFKIRRNPAVPIPGAWPRPEWDDEAQKDIYFLGDSAASGFGKGPSDHVATLILDEAASAELRQAQPSAAFFRVAPNTVAQFPFFEEAVLKRTGTVISSAPTFTAGRMPLAEIVGSVDALLNGSLREAS